MDPFGGPVSASGDFGAANGDKLTEIQAAPEWVASDESGGPGESGYLKNSPTIFM